MLQSIAQQLDAWIAEKNFEAHQEGLPQLHACTIRVLGQTALLLAELPIAIAATVDVDVRADYAYTIQKKFERLLAKEKRTLDPLGSEVWMPRETRYLPVYEGRWVSILVADPEAVLLSKAIKAPEKNRHLLTEYLATCASQRFFELATKYGLNLEQFL